MPPSLNSRVCGNVYIIQCKGRIVAGDEAKSLEGALHLGAREFARLVLHGLCTLVLTSRVATPMRPLRSCSRCWGPTALYKSPPVNWVG